MPLEVLVQFRCDKCPTTFVAPQRVTNVPGFPLDVKATIGMVPPGWRCAGEETFCPVCVEKRVVVAPASTLAALDQRTKQPKSH